MTETPSKLMPYYSGKVRDLYDLDGHILMVVSDRVSAYDTILGTEIPSKGIVLSKLTKFFTRKFAHILQAHNVKSAILDIDPPEHFKERGMVLLKCDPLPIEAIVRGYLFGSAYAAYAKDGSVCGIQLPPGLQQASKLPEPIFSPSTKAALGDHDENISFDEMTELCGQTISDQVKACSLDLFKTASAYAESKGILLCDTKFEFGLHNNQLYLIDEVLTPDSSRYWPKSMYAVNTSPPSFDKQFIRDYLTKNQLKHKEDVKLPQHIVDETIAKYKLCLDLLTSQ